MPLPENIIILFYWTAPERVFFSYKLWVVGYELYSFSRSDCLFF